MKIFIGSDHRGFDLKTAIQQEMPEYQWEDVGCCSIERTDYPIYAAAVCEKMAVAASDDRGILLCSSGVGMSIAANRHKGVYAALCWNEAIAASARADDNANILVLPASVLSVQEAIILIRVFLTTPFKEDPVYGRRLSMIDK